MMKTIRWIIIICIALILIGAGVCFFLLSDKDDTNIDSLQNEVNNEIEDNNK